MKTSFSIQAFKKPVSANLTPLYVGVISVDRRAGYRRARKPEHHYSFLDARRAASPVASLKRWRGDVEYRKPPTPLCMRFKICLDKDLYGFFAGVHSHSDRCVAKIYFMTTTVLASNNRMRHFPAPICRHVTNMLLVLQTRSAQPWGSSYFITMAVNHGILHEPKVIEGDVQLTTKLPPRTGCAGASVRLRKCFTGSQ